MPLSVSAAANGPAAVVVWTLPTALRGDGGLAEDRDALWESFGDFEAVGASCV
jgi:hypothetical protein